MADTRRPRRLEPLHRFGHPDARARSADALARDVSSLLAGPAAAELGRLQAGPLDHDGHEATWPGLHSGPAPGFGGAELHHNLGSGGLGTLSPEVIACEMQRTLDGIEWHRAAAAAAVGDARERAALAIEARGGVPQPVRLTAVTFSAAAPGGLLVGLDVEILGHDLTRRVVPLLRMAGPAEHPGLSDALAAHERRTATLAALRPSGSVGWIDETARLVLAHVGLGMDEVVRRLRRLNRLSFRFDDRRWTARLAWNEGVLTADIHDNAANVGLHSGELPLGAGLPDTLLDALPGRRLGEVAVVEHPFLSPDAVAETFVHGGVRHARIVVPTTPIPERKPSHASGTTAG